MSFSKFASFSIIFFMSSAGVLAEFHSYDPSRVLALADKLSSNEFRMFSYAEFALKRSISRFPAESGLLKVKLGEVYIKWNKWDKGEGIIASIPGGDVNFKKGQLTLGIGALRKSKLKFGVKLLEKYVYSFDKITDPDLSEDFKKAVQFLSHAYGQLGRPNDSSSIWDLPDKVIRAKDVAGVTAESRRREKNLHKIRALLYCAEDFKAKEDSDPEFAKSNDESRIKRARDISAYKKRLDKNPSEILKLPTNFEMDYKLIAESTLAPLLDLRWLQDSIACFSYGERARALFLLGRYEEALKELNSAHSLLKPWDDAFRKNDMVGEAPGADVRFWMANVYLAMGEKELEPVSREKFFSNALKLFGQVLIKYQGYRRSNDAILRFSQCKDVLESKFGRKIVIKNKNLKLKPMRSNPVDKITMSLFNEGKYSKVIPKLLKLFHENRRSNGRSEILRLLAYAYAKKSEHMKAIAVTDYIANYGENLDQTAIALLQTGQILWGSASESEEYSSEKERKDNAIRVYQKYLDLAPTHQYASAISARVANERFDRASALAEKARKLSGEEKKDMAAKAIEAYTDVSRDYKRIVDNYATSEYGNISLYLMGTCYSASKRFDEAAKTFLIYCDKEERDIPKVAKAKLRVADNHFQAAQRLEKQARELRDKIYALGK